MHIIYIQYKSMNKLSKAGAALVDTISCSILHAEFGLFSSYTPSGKFCQVQTRVIELFEEKCLFAQN